jgi:hypothetical protein
VDNTFCAYSAVTLYSSVRNMSQLTLACSWSTGVVRTAREAHGWDFATVLSFWHATVRVCVAGDLFLLPHVCEVCVIYGGGFERTGLHIMQDANEMNKRKFGMSQETIKTDGLDVIVWRRWQ